MRKQIFGPKEEEMRVESAGTDVEVGLGLKV